ncbi:MAG: DUF5926 family protein [Bifidobacteriaceae bacterium]|jgi:hypothetical protein|nr:DUF5926 family protein [Bifidobacteriaceae bacterium]
MTPEAKPDYSVRPFAGLPSEGDWVALREVVPAATATARLNAEHGGAAIEVTTLLPEIRPAWKRADGTPVLALQSTFSSEDPGLDLGQALELAIAAEPGSEVKAIDPGRASARLQDLLDLNEAFVVTVQPGFDYWADLNPELAETLEPVIKQASDAIVPSAAVPEVASAYWTKLNGRPFVRWSLGVDEPTLLDGLARLQAKRQAGVVDGAKYAGAFRALGLIIPVWELPAGTEAADLTQPLTAYRELLDAALANRVGLTVAERRARAGLVARSVTLR